MTSISFGGNTFSSRFTEFLIFGALLLTFGVAVGELAGISLQQSGVKHLVGLALISTCILDMSGRYLYPLGRSSINGGNAYWWMLFFLGVYVVAGSLYARLELNIREPFLIFGLYILVGWFFFRMLLVGNFQGILLMVAGLTLLVAVLTSGGTIYARISDFSVKDTVIHEREFLVIPMLYLVIFGNILSKWKRTVVAALILLAAVAAMKNTPTLVLAATGVMILWRWRSARQFRKINNSHPLVANILISYIIVSVIVVAFLYTVLVVRDATPINNLSFRQHQYSVAWNEFLDSPVFGSAFTSETGIFYNLRMDVVQGAMLPTHNDVLDILRGGGLVGFALWFIPISVSFWQSFVLLMSAAKSGIWSTDDDWLAWLLLTNFGAVIVYLFNPILTKTAFASLVWIFLAILSVQVMRMRGRLVR